jgi:hypothetical protein
VTTDLKALAKLRDPFPKEQIGKLPKGGLQLDFVGHGYITQRLLDVDPLWNWEPVAYDPQGLPLIDEYGGLWIKLTVSGVTRLGYGDAAGRKGNDAIKVAIGDALRNAGMRFGLALDLWCKGDPDTAPAAPRPKSSADIARDKLLAVCKNYKLNAAEIAARFTKENAMPVTKANADTITTFTQMIQQEQEQP